MLLKSKPGYAPMPACPPFSDEVASLAPALPSWLFTLFFLQITSLVSHLDGNYCDVNADEDLVSLASLKRSSPMWQTLSGYGTPPTI